MLSLRERPLSHRVRRHAPHFLEMARRAQTAHAGDNRIEQTKKEKAEIPFARQLAPGILFGWQWIHRLQMGQYQRPKMFEQLPIAQLCFGQSVAFENLRHAHSQPQPGSRYNRGIPYIASSSKNISRAEQNWIVRCFQ